MPSPFIGGRIPQDLHDALQKHIAESGEKLPQILQRALSSYLNYSSPTVESQEAIEQRIAILESSFRELREAFEQIQQSPQLQEGKVAEQDSSLLGQLSLLEQSKDDNKTDILPDIDKAEESDIKTDISHDTDDNKADILPDIKDTPTDEVEVITGEELSRRTQLADKSISIYYSQNREVVRGEFRYRPIRKEGKRRKKGEEMKWAVEPVF